AASEKMKLRRTAAKPYGHGIPNAVWPMLMTPMPPTQRPARSHQDGTSASGRLAAPRLEKPPKARPTVRHWKANDVSPAATIKGAPSQTPMSRQAAAGLFTAPAASAAGPST